MKVLLDSCVWGGAREPIAAAGHEVDWVRGWPADPGDDEILARAHAEGRVLVTLDKDFGELAITQGARHAGIIRLVGFAARQQGLASVEVLRRHGEDLAAGALITAEPGRMRIRLP